MSHEGFRAGSGSHLRPHDFRLLVHIVLLLHEKVDEATKNDALDGGSVVS